MISQLLRGLLHLFDAPGPPDLLSQLPKEGEFFIDNLLVLDNLLVRIHSIIVTILADRPCAMGV